MNTSAFAERLNREHQAAAPIAAHRGGEARKAALDALAAIGLPTTRDDNWKYANLRALERVRLAPATPSPYPLPRKAGERVPEAGEGVIPARIDGFSRQVFVDGLYRAELSDLPSLHPALTFDSPPHGEDARFALLNAAFGVEGARIIARPDSGVPSSIELIFMATADGAAAASYPRVELVVEPDARLQLIERHLSASDAASFVNTAAAITVSERAHLSHYRIQQTSARTLWVDTLGAEVGREASYELHSIALGASSARSTCLIRLAGEAAHVGAYAAAVADRQQVLDGYVRIEHAAPRTTTDEVFRGIAAGRSRVAFNGIVVVQPEARGADSKQSLRGLLAGPEAEIDARPQLEIYTDDVRCSHGATAGTLDENMLFYLLSRGIDRETARSLLEWVFLEDVIAKIGVRELRRQIESVVAGRLRGVTNLEELL
ncbi:MAG: SufD family Fe-S cluster assembly protein [Gammaproteobacteria bacterium]